jgi:hypothetical protein
MRVLKTSTIVPNNLYIERAADRQLRAVIDEMGRPAYILVARQMGKTNLLLNMKRERASDIVLYLDLSNRFDTSLAWFRNVIDRLLDAYPDHFSKSIEFIEKQRKEVTLDPNVEYDRHLRYILRETDRRIIIILDEIDSLINTPYSDVILAQVRSMYFSRANHPEYERLTYVLSGVVEPTDLIKDKNISPFNIGEKIYLESFTREESDRFLKNVFLGENPELLESVYSWANGNPRMTWDICAELELHKENQHDLSTQLVDEVVKKLYLESFDKAPIDHIRTLAESDPQIQEALVQLRYNRGAFLEQKLKSRLYLSGITNTAGSTNIHIANRIIDFALSDEWTIKAESFSTDSKEQIEKKYEQKDYATVIKLIEKLALTTGSEDRLSLENRLLLGLSYLSIAKPSEAIREFKLCNDDGIDAATLQQLQYYLGLGYNTIGEHKDALIALSAAAEGPILDLRQRAKIVMILAMLDLNKIKYRVDALELCTELIDELSGSDEPPSTEAKSKLAAVFYVAAKAHIALEKPILALEYLQQAKKTCSPEAIPIVLLTEYELALQKGEREDFLINICDVIVDGHLQLYVDPDFSLDFNKKHLALILVLLEEHSLSIYFDKLLKYYVVQLQERSLSPFSALKDLYGEFNQSKDQSNYSKLLVRALNDYLDDEVDALSRIEVLREVIANHNATEDELKNLYQKYLDALDSNLDIADKFFDLRHLDTLTYLGYRNDLAKDNETLRRVFKIWHKYEEHAPTKGAEILITFMNAFEMRLYRNIGDMDKARHSASKVISEIDLHSPIIQKGIEAEAIRAIRREARALLKLKSGVSQPLREQVNDPYRGIGRNDKVVVQYGDRPPVEKKFKLVEADLRQNLCTLLSHSTNK